ncbi:MAG: hexameric tyrosine-coordinated heme protein [Solirubrobacteraceae bacterium]|nr:hexameric tyrosine-coordinated heme protein [Solirubrobacteraceae bacterium]
MDELVPGNTLITATPDEGRALAIKLARLTVKAIQPDGEVRTRLRPTYAEDADSLTAAAHAVAVEFATIAAANDYWRTGQR